jgi:hypothetical protein
MPAVSTHHVTLGDTLFPFKEVVRDENGNPRDLTAYTVTFKMELQDGTVELAATATGVTAHPTQAFTAEADDEYLTCRSHGLDEGDQIIVANSGGALPTGLAASTPYFAVNVTPNKFQVATLPQGAAINITADGTGTQTFYKVGQVQMDLAAANVDTAGIYYGWFILTASTETLHWPSGTNHIEIRVVPVGN